MPDATFDDVDRVETRGDDHVVLTTPDGDEHEFDRPGESDDMVLIRFGDAVGIDADSVQIYEDRIGVRSSTDIEVDADRAEVTAKGADATVEVDADRAEVTAKGADATVDADAKTVELAKASNGGSTELDAERLVRGEAKNGGRVLADVDGASRIETTADDEWVPDAERSDMTEFVLDEVEQVGTIEATQGVVRGKAYQVEKVEGSTGYSLPAGPMVSDPTGAERAEPFVNPTEVSLDAVWIGSVEADRADLDLTAAHISNVVGERADVNLNIKSVGGNSGRDDNDIKKIEATGGSTDVKGVGEDQDVEVGKIEAIGGTFDVEGVEVDEIDAIDAEVEGADRGLTEQLGL